MRSEKKDVSCVYNFIIIRYSIFLCFVMIFGFAIENHAKTGNVFLLYLGLTPEAINIPFLTELFNHDAVCRIFDMDVYLFIIL